MSQDTQVNPIRFIAGADLSASSNLYKAVKLLSNGNIAIAGVGDHAIGILALVGPSGAPVAVAIDRTTKAVAGCAIVPGNKLMPGANGVLVTVTATTGVDSIGIALETAATNDVFEMFIEKLKY